MKYFLIAFLLLLTTGCGSFGTQVIKLRIPGISPKTQVSNIEKQKPILDYYINKIYQRDLKPGDEFEIGSANYRVFEPVKGGYMFLHYSDDFVNYMPLILKTDREAFTRENFANISTKLSYIGVNQYTTILGSRKQIMVFEDIDTNR